MFEFKLKLNKFPDRYSCNVGCHFKAYFILIKNASSLYGNTMIDLPENCLKWHLVKNQNRQRFSKIKNNARLLLEFKLELNKLPDRYSCNVGCHFEENFILIKNPSS